VEVRGESFDLIRGDGELTPCLHGVGSKFGAGGRWLVRVVDIFVDESDEPAIAFRYLYPADELPASELEPDFDAENELAVGSQVHIAQLEFVQGAERVRWDVKTGPTQREPGYVTRRAYDEVLGRLSVPTGAAVI